MITPDNLSEILDSLTESQITTAFDASPDFLLFEVSIFNAGFVATLECMDYDPLTETETHDNGNVFVDKDEFLQLVAESATINPFLLEQL
jgi:hypothetical protein